MRVVTVDTQTQVRGVLIGCAAPYSVGTSKRAVGPAVGGGAGKNVNFERASGFMLFFGTGCQRFGHYFGGAGGGKAGESENIAVV